MADSHPYISGAGNVAKMITHLRKSFPQTVSSETVKKLGLASNNESYVINALQFVGIINEEGKKTPEATKVFSHHSDGEFSKEFSKLVEKSYSSLFELHGVGAWDLGTDDLITFFRRTDETSDAIGRRQAQTFRMFASLSGHGDAPDTKTNKAKVMPKAKTKTKSDTTAAKQVKNKSNSSSNLDSKRDSSGQQNTKDFGLTVRVEINLPPDGTKETYDNIFKSIKENLIDG